jgi:hypothetical protein
MTTTTASAANGSAANTVTFTYTAGPGGMANGKVSLQAPSGWSAPSTTPTDAGYTTSSLGSVGVSGQTVTVSGLTLSSGSSITLTYGRKSGGGPGATASSSAGAQTWQAKSQGSGAGSLQNLASSPSITVLSADGSGTMDASPNSVTRSSSGNTITLTYTAATGGMVNGYVRVVVPSGWSAPSTTPGTNGYVTSSQGSVAVSGQQITVSGLTRDGGQTFTITYGSTSGGGAGATAPSSAGAQTWTTSERSGSPGGLVAIATQPAILVTP